VSVRWRYAWAWFGIDQALTGGHAARTAPILGIGVAGHVAALSMVQASTRHPPTARALTGRAVLVA
jgi:hypothetical protein